MGGYRTAFALSKTEVRDARPLGTAVLIDHELVRTTTGNHEYVEDHLQLVPEPSQDPADPLNFPMWRKLAILSCMSLYAFITNVSSAIISSALPELVTAFATFSRTGPPTGLVPFSSLTHLIAVNILMLGASNIWWVPLGNTFGRRPIILVSILLLTGCSVWCGAAQSYPSLLAARVFQGIGGGAADTLAADVVGQIFFVHQRGRAMAIYTMMLVSGSLIGGLIGGYVTASLSWRWTCYIPAIMSGCLFVLTFFLVPETLFDRTSAIAIAHEPIAEEDDVNEKSNTSRIESAPHHAFPPYTFARSLKLGTYRPGLLKRLVTPYTTLLFPGTWMVMLQYGGLVGLTVTASTIAPVLLAQPPYLWGANVGLINAGGLVGSILGAVYTYLAADWWVKRVAKRDSHGYGEPEARVPLMFPALVIAFAGALAFGFSAQALTPKAWIGLEFGSGMIAFGLMQVPSIGFNYLIECYGGWASDCFLMVVTFRAVIGFAWTFFVGTWTASAGFALPFGIFALLMGVFALTAVPVWLCGKRFRIAGENLIQKEFAVR
ncbi:hypothetical protein AAFC00_003929 [Neodothiora populina]|uniref:Major facilitator superfamily (MFS) profile domain-containing protein n=1 Tax=Neodothiora populina TaxID=2781224 RepID=A0ABR3PG41_9PEZI